MNPYDAPQTFEPTVKEAPPKRKRRWAEIALLLVMLVVTEYVINFFRELEQEREKAKLMQQSMPQAQPPTLANP